MTSPRHLTVKLAALQVYGAIHPHPEAVTDPLFAASDFLDAHALVQPRYEMARRVQVDRQPVSRVATAFGVSRPTVYQTLATVHAAGLPGLLPRRRGPQRGHKLRPEIVAFIAELVRSAARREYPLSRRRFPP